MQSGWRNKKSFLEEKYISISLFMKKKDMVPAEPFLKEWQKSYQWTWDVWDQVLSVPKDRFLSVPRIAHKEQVLLKLKEYSKVRTECNCSELSNVLGISRQTIYNWMDRGYLLINDYNKIKVLETYNYWMMKEIENKTYKRQFKLWSDIFWKKDLTELTKSLLNIHKNV